MTFQPRSVENKRAVDEVETDRIHPPGFFGKYERMYIDDDGVTLLGEFTYARHYTWAISVFDVPEYLIHVYYAKKNRVYAKWDDGTVRVITR